MYPERMMKRFENLPARIQTRIRPVLKRFRNWRALERKASPLLKLELTNICNANCVFCGYQYENRLKGYMPDDLYDKALQQYARWNRNGRLSFIPIVGEPLVDPKLLARIRRAKELGIPEIYFYTNGILLYKFDIEALLTSGLTHLSISTSPFDAESFERLYRNTNYARLLEGVEKLLIANRDLGHPVDIHFLIRSDISREKVLAKPDYRRHIRPYINEARDVGVMVKGFDTWGGMIRKEDLFGEMTLAEIPQDKSRPCSQTFTLTVLWDGRVRACGCRLNNDGVEDPLILGNLNTQSLEEIWNGEKLRAVRRSFEQGKLCDLCRKCTSYTPV